MFARDRQAGGSYLMTAETQKLGIYLFIPFTCCVSSVNNGRPPPGRQVGPLQSQPKRTLENVNIVN